MRYAFSSILITDATSSLVADWLVWISSKTLPQSEQSVKSKPYLFRFLLSRVLYQQSFQVYRLVSWLQSYFDWNESMFSKSNGKSQHKYLHLLGKNGCLIKIQLKESILYNIFVRKMINSKLLSIH